MILEAKQQDRGVLRLRCRQPIPLSPFAAGKECDFKQLQASGRDESIVRSFTVSSFTLRCRVCDVAGPRPPLDPADLTPIEAIGPAANTAWDRSQYKARHRCLIAGASA